MCTICQLNLSHQNHSIGDTWIIIFSLLVGYKPGKSVLHWSRNWDPPLELPFLKTSSYATGSSNAPKDMHVQQSSTRVQCSYIPSGKESTCEVSVISQELVARSKSSSSSWVVMTVVLQPEGESSCSVAY